MATTVINQQMVFLAGTEFTLGRGVPWDDGDLWLTLLS